MADIIVQVSSAGLTAYGNNTWSSETFGGDQSTIISVNSFEYVGEPNGWGQFTWGFNEWGDLINPNVDVTGLQLNTSVGNEEAFTDISLILSTNLISSTVDTVTLVGGALEEPSFVLANTTTGTVFAGENVIVEVTTPGTATTWGEYLWGSAAWGQISGTLVKQGEEDITGTGVVNLTGPQSNTTTGTFTIIGDANLTLNTNIINITVASILAVVDVIVEVNSPGNLPWGTTSWGYGSWGNIGGMDIEQGAEEEAVPSIEVDVTGNALILSLTSIAQVTGDANVTPNTNLLTVSLGDEDAIPNTLVDLSTNLITLSMGTASGEALTTAAVVSVTATCQTGRVFITAWAVINIGVTNNWSVVDIAA